MPEIKSLKIVNLNSKFILR